MKNRHLKLYQNLGFTRALFLKSIHLICILSTNSTRWYLLSIQRMKGLFHRFTNYSIDELSLTQRVELISISKRCTFVENVLMPYPQFTSIKRLKKQFGIEVQYRNLFDRIEPLPPSDWLQDSLAIYTRKRTAFFSEKSRSEAIVFPILAEMQKHFNYEIAIYSGANLEADQKQGLNGECDFILSKGEQGIELEHPFVCIVEAKDKDIEQGIPQCLAQLIGAKMVNEKEAFSTPVLYGAATIGDTWLFLKLEDKLATIDNKHYYLNQLPELLGLLKEILS